MKKIIFISIAVASLSTTAPTDARIAGHRTYHHHLVMGGGVSPVLLNANASLNNNASLDGSGNDRAMRIRNLHDSGYNPKDDFDSFGNISVAY